MAQSCLGKINLGKFNLHGGSEAVAEEEYGSYPNLWTRTIDVEHELRTFTVGSGKRDFFILPDGGIQVR